MWGWLIFVVCLILFCDDNILLDLLIWGVAIIGVFCWLIWDVVIFVVSSILTCDDDKEDISDVPNSSDAEPLLSVADRLEKLYGGKAFVGLRIPDFRSASHCNIDLVLVTKDEVLVILVKDVAPRFQAVDKDGYWFCSGDAKGFGDNDSKHQIKRIPSRSLILSALAEAKEQVLVLQSYLVLRGIKLPQGFLSCKVICSNPDFPTVRPDYLPSEVITNDEWVQLKPKTKNTETNTTQTKTTLYDWFSGASSTRKQEMQKMKELEELQETRYRKLKFVLGTAPMWDRLAINGSRQILGEILQIKGSVWDAENLKKLKRSKVSHLITEKPLRQDRERVTIKYTPRDYHVVWASTSVQKKESSWARPNLVSIRSKTMVLFQARHSNKVCRCKLSSIVSMTLSA